MRNSTMSNGIRWQRDGYKFKCHQITAICYELAQSKRNIEFWGGRPPVIMNWTIRIGIVKVNSNHQVNTNLCDKIKMYSKFSSSQKWIEMLSPGIKGNMVILCDILKTSLVSPVDHQFTDRKPILPQIETRLYFVVWPTSILNEIKVDVQSDRFVGGWRPSTRRLS